MAQTEISGEDPAPFPVQSKSPAQSHNPAASDSSAYSHVAGDGTNHVFENGFEAAEPPVPSDPGNNGYIPQTSQALQPSLNAAPQSQHTEPQHEANGPAPTFQVTDGSAEDDSTGSLSSAAAEPDAKPAQPAKDMSKPSNRRLWFVRVPRPADDPNIRLLEREMESYKAQVRLLNESLAVKRVEKESAKESTQTAWDNLNACKGQVNSKQAALEPLRGARDARNNANKEFRSAFGDLDVRSEEELDARLASIRHTMEHESIPLAEEKRLMKQMSTLSSQRERVRKYAAAHASIGLAKEDADRNHASLKELEAENKALWEEKKLASSILTKYKDEEKLVDDALKDIHTERRRIKDLQDEVYARLQETRQAHRAKLDDFYDNRRLSQMVRSMIKEGKLEEARTLCKQQTEEKLGQLWADEGYRRHYNLLWQQQRNQPISLGGDSDLGTGYVEPAIDHSPPSKSAAAAGSAKEALSSIGNKVANTLHGAAQSVKAAAKQESHPSAAKSAAPPAARPAASQAASLPAAAAPKPSPQKPAAPQPKPAPIPNGIAHQATPIEFVLPSSLPKAAEPELSEEEQKAKVREQNRIAAEEAELRKERRKRDQEKKKAKALDKRQQREAAEKQRLEAEAAAAAAKAAEPEPEEVPEDAAATAATASAQEDASLQPAIGRANARVRPRAKRSNFDLRIIWRQYSTQILVVAVVVLALLMINVCYSLFSSSAT